MLKELIEIMQDPDTAPQTKTLIWIGLLALCGFGGLAFFGLLVYLGGIG